MLMPKKVKYRKQQRGRMRGKAWRGGAIAFGFIGVFLGPVLLAVGYALLMEWAASRTSIELVTPHEHDASTRKSP